MLSWRATNNFKIQSSFLVPVSPPTVPDSPPIATLTSVFATAVWMWEGVSVSKQGIIGSVLHLSRWWLGRRQTPFSCSGSVGLIHKACIEKWLSTVNQVTNHMPVFRSRELYWPIRTRAISASKSSSCLVTPSPSPRGWWPRPWRMTRGTCSRTRSVSSSIYTIWLLLTIRYHCQVKILIFTLKTCFNCVHFGQVGFKWRVNNQDIRLLDVTTNQPKSLCLWLWPWPNMWWRLGGRRKSLLMLADFLRHPRLRMRILYFFPEPTDEQAPILISPVKRLLPPFSTPLSPVVIPTDPGSLEYASVVVSSTPESDIYATTEQLGVGATRNYLCPYLHYSLWFDVTSAPPAPSETRNNIYDFYQNDMFYCRDMLSKSVTRNWMCNIIYIFRNALDFWPLVLLPVYEEEFWSLVLSKELKARRVGLNFIGILVLV